MTPRHSRTFLPSLLAVTVSTVLASGAARAEDAAEMRDGEVRLETIVVTAQYRREDIASVPLAVSAIERNDLALIGSSARDVLALSARAPSLIGESSFGRTFPRFYIRGLGNTDFDLNASQPVSLVYDGVVLENPTLKGFPIFDLERVEVLRGPQGTLFGRNTPGGVVRFESRRPMFTPDAYARVGYGRWNTANVEAAVGGPVGADSAVRLSGLYQRRDDFSRNDVLGDRREGFVDYAVRGQWLIRSDDRFEARVQVTARDLDGGSQVYRANSIVPGTNHQPKGFDRFELSQDARPKATLQTRGASVTLDWALDHVNVTSISAYESVHMFARGDVDGGYGADFTGTAGPGSIPFPAETGDGIPEHHQLSQEIRVASRESDAGDWQAGLFVFDESLHIENIAYDTLSGSVRNGFARQQQDNQAYAAYVEGGLNLGEAWRIGAGLRYTHDRKDFWAERLQSPIGAGALDRIVLHPSDDNLSGDLSARWQPMRDLTVHARVATGFRAPSIQGRVLFGDTVSVADSETIVSGELGANIYLLHERLQFDLNVFGYRLNHAQMTAVGGAANFNTLINADQVDGRGAELELRALLGEHLKLAAGGSYNHTAIDDPLLGVQPCAAPCTILDPPGVKPGTVSIDGNPLPQSPTWIAYLTAAYERPLGQGVAFAQTDWSYRSEVNFFLYQSREFTGPSLVDGGVRVGYRWGGTERYEFAVLSRNVLNKIVAIGGVDFNNLTAFYNEPRYVGAEFSVRY